ncbi:FkbM family methyltransferase [Methylosinus sp. R-45379]|uniref:FkbM family methyltransferase n=1 Tax=Methylosinus sp. R-45379 TaxID=980563 RepID=UPI0009FE74B1|nr:FkbM family methyltransferase [Methylosinus sp. R-45379]
MLENFVRKVFWRLGLDVKRARLASSSTGLMLNLLECSGASIILDVGANEGQFASEVLSFRPRQQIISFEPGSSAYQKLSAAARKCSSWTVAERMALGAESADLLLHVTENSQCSSLLAVAEGGPKLGTAFEVVGKEPVKVIRLDSYQPICQANDQLFYLKIDVQGYEIEVFEGCRGLLPRIVAVQVELSFKEVYAGQVFGLESIRNFLEDGFVVYGISNGWRDSSTGQLIQIDVFLIKSSAH